MKKQLLAIVATLSIVITLTVTGLASLSTKVTANIPFDFMVSGKTLPAGTYTVVQGSTKNTLVIRSRENSVAIGAITMEATDKSKAKARLVFRRYGNQRFLAQVFDGYSGEGQELPKSKAEREAAKAAHDHLAQQGNTPEIITLFAQAGQ
jgi:hypothetical protein